ncbi:MAG: ATP-grasp domain-containing protein [Archangium sp.]
MKNVAIISAGADETAVGVQEALTRLGARSLFIDTSIDSPLSLEDGRVRFGDEDVTDVRTVYVKSVHLAVPLFDVEALAQRAPKSWPERWVAERERHGHLTSAFRTWELAGAYFVNPVSKFEVHLLKPLQSEVLRGAGVKVPSSLTTNDPQAVRAFFERHGDVIYKPVGGGALVRRLKKADLKRLPSLSTSPVLFQQRIEGDEFRVTVLGEHVVSAYKLPATGVVDAREVLERAVKMKAPSVVAKAAIRAARALGLIFTSVDVRVTKQGVPYVLECNPTPSVASYEAAETSPIIQSLAEYLVNR